MRACKKHYHRARTWEWRGIGMECNGNGTAVAWQWRGVGNHWRGNGVGVAMA